MNLREIARLRLRNQRVSGARLKSAEQVVGWLGCVQSQEYPLAKWSLAQRASGFVDADVDACLRDGRILRTHILRPTWHFVLPADIRWMMKLTAPRVGRFLARPANGGSPADTALVARALDVIREALSGRRRMTRVQLVKLLRERGLALDPIQMGRIFIRAELDLLLVSGGLAGKAQTYALLDDVAPPPEAEDRDGFDRDWALGELARRYFTSRGPATIADFTWWSSLTVAETKRAIEINAGALERMEFAGTAYWWAGEVGGDGADTGTGEPSPALHLMQAYDEYIVAYRSPRHPINVDGLVPPSAMSRPPFLHAVIVDTQLIGWWRRVAVRDGYVIETRLARPLTAEEQRALQAQAARYEAFLGAPVSLAPVVRTPDTS